MSVVNSISKTRVVLLALLILFLSPGIIAIYAYQHPEKLMVSLTNHGTFIKPPIMVNFLEESKHWHIVFYETQQCTLQCLNRIDEIARVRLALGRKLYQIDFDVWLAPTASDFTAEEKQVLNSINVKFKKMTCDDEYLLGKISKEPQIYLIAPGGNIVVKYPPNVESKALFHDLNVVLGH